MIGLCISNDILGCPKMLLLFLAQPKSDEKLLGKQGHGQGPISYKNCITLHAGEGPKVNKSRLALVPILTLKFLINIGLRMYVSQHIPLEI